MTRSLSTLFSAGLVSMTVACSDQSPTAPSRSATGSPRAGHTIAGRTVVAIDGAALAGITVKIANAPPVVSDSGGYFRIESTRVGRHGTTISGDMVVERRTSVAAPSSDGLMLSLIPRSFDLMTFDQMFRGSNGRLQRWTSAPALVLQTSVLDFTSASADHFFATDEQALPDDLDSLTANLVWGLSQLTGGRFTVFSEVTRETAAPGGRVNVIRIGSIVVGRYRGLQNLGGAVGYGRWAYRDDGTVVGGVICLDRDFDTVAGQLRRSLHVHELGHALGYAHVTTRESVMNPAVGLEPTDFDREGAAIAFQRPPGNRSPDIDPDRPANTLAPGSPVRWGPLIP